MVCAVLNQTCITQGRAMTVSACITVQYHFILAASITHTEFLFNKPLPQLLHDGTEMVDVVVVLQLPHVPKDNLWDNQKQVLIHVKQTTVKALQKVQRYGIKSSNGFIRS